MSEATVLTEARGHILAIVLNRPAARNAINVELASALQAAFDAYDADPELRVAVVGGAGVAFSAGADLKMPRPRTPGRSEVRERLRFLETGCRKPVIAAVEGFALGGGLEIALAADLIVAAENARLGIPEVRWGLVAAGGGLVRLPLRLPLGVAKEMALTGEPASAPDLHRLGLVNVLTAPGEALGAAMKLAEKIAANAPLAVAASKAILDGSQSWTLQESWERQIPLSAPVFTSDDAQEGGMAFRERRAPRWTGQASTSSGDPE